MSHRQPPSLASWSDFSQHRASALALLASNALPLLGVLFWGWSTFAIVLIYWSENVAIGLMNVLKMVFCANSTDESSVGEASPIFSHSAKLFFVPFFTVHYGIFCLVHGVFVFALLGDGNGLFSGIHVASLIESGTVWAILCLLLSHFFSFLKNYLWGGEYRQASLPELMAKPYGRIVVLHLAILFGAFATLALGSPIWVLMILIVGKTALDLALHLREHRDASQNQSNQRDPDQNCGNDGFDAGA